MNDIGVSYKGINLRDEKVVERLIMRIHRYAGHCSASVFVKFAAYYGLTIKLNDISDILTGCDTCRHSKQNAKPVGVVEKDRDLIIAYTDITQPNKEGIGNMKWFVTFIDDADEMLFTAPLKRKSDFFHVLVTY